MESTLIRSELRDPDRPQNTFFIRCEPVEDLKLCHIQAEPLLDLSYDRPLSLLLAKWSPSRQFSIHHHMHFGAPVEACRPCNGCPL